MSCSLKIDRLNTLECGYVELPSTGVLEVPKMNADNLVNFELIERKKEGTITVTFRRDSGASVTFSADIHGIPALYMASLVRYIFKRATKRKGIGEAAEKLNELLMHLAEKHAQTD